MEGRHVGDWIDTYLSYTNDDEPSFRFRKWVAIGTVAAALRRKCYCIWKRHMVTYPNMYIVLVGPSGIGKGAAMGPALSLLKELDVPLSSQSITREALIEDLRASAAESFLVDNSVVTQSSITIFSKELAVFLGFKNLELIMALTDWFDCDDVWHYKTISRDVRTINGVWVNLIGGTTPALIQSTMPQDAVGGGLTSRMIFVYSDCRGRVDPISFDSHEDTSLRLSLLQDLEHISTLNGRFRYQEDFIDVWVPWYTKAAHRLGGVEEKFAGYTERRPLHLMKLCMIHSAARSDSMIITAGDFHRSLESLEEVEQDMSKVYAGYGRAYNAQLIPMIQKIVLSGRVTRSDLLRNFMTDMSRKDLEETLMTFQECGLCKITMEDGEMVIYPAEKETKKP
jgi:hypothetical protein